MGGPAWLAGVFAGLVIIVAVSCAVRLAVARWRDRPAELDADGVHVVMGVAMAGMLVARGPAVSFGPPGAWAAVFGAAGAWFASKAVRLRRGGRASPWRCPHPAPHLVESAAMAYMFLAPPASRAGVGMGMPTGSRFSVVTLALAVFMAGYVVWLADRITVPPADLAGAVTGGSAGEPGHVGAGCRPGWAGRAFLAPRYAACCKIAMGITMGYMLILML